MLSKYLVTLRHGENNSRETREIIKHNFAFNAAKLFLIMHFPGETFCSPLRVEQEKGTLVWSVATTASGQRVWIREVA
jgi:hypothetical protein